MIEATIDTGKPIESDAEDPFSGLIKMFSDPKLPPHGHRRYVLIRRASGELVFQQDATDFWLEHAAASSCGTRPPSGPRVIRFDRGEKRAQEARGLLAAGAGHRCHLGERLQFEVENIED
jgi:hypothetical protein